MWTPQFRAAAVAPDGRFTVVLAERDYDDPFSVIISYDPRLSQPWSRVDVGREIVDVTYAPFGQGEQVPVALSNEGDVYTLTDVVRRSKIPGAGILSEDADGRGQTWLIGAVGPMLYVAGENGQFYQGGQDSWNTIALPDPELSVVAWDTNSGDGVIIACETARKAPAIDYSSMTSADNIMAMMQEQIQAAETAPPQSYLFMLHDSIFAPIDAPLVSHIRDIQSSAADRLVAVGVADLVLVGTTAGMTQAALPKHGLSYISGVNWGDAIWLASDTQVYRWADGALQSVNLDLSPFIANGRGTPLALAPSGDALYYFDYRQDVRFWDGNSWTVIAMPAPLKARDYDPEIPL